MSATPFPVPIAEYVERARADAALFLDARMLFADRADKLFDRGDHAKTAITSSDAGRCSKQTLAEIAGEYDLPDGDYWSRDAGTLQGAWVACLLATAIEASHLDYFCVLEHTSSFEGVSGHSDVGVYCREDSSVCAWTIELKHTASFSVRPPHEPGKTVPANIGHALQACQRALADGAPLASVFTKGAGGAWDQSDYDVSSWLEPVRAEYARLARGEADATKAWQCQGCRLSSCARNTNPLRPPTELLAALEASVKAAS